VKYKLQIFCISQQYFIPHFRQSSVSVIFIVIHSQFPCKYT